MKKGTYQTILKHRIGKPLPLILELTKEEQVGLVSNLVPLINHPTVNGKMRTDLANVLDLVSKARLIDA